MSWNLVSLDHVPPQPWRNGGGVTRELLAWPAGGDWRVRMSVADVASDGPFSHFPGVQRWFAVLEGAGVALAVGHAQHRLGADSDPFPFDGSADVQCRLLAGPTRDFNLMAPPGPVHVQRLRGAVTRAWTSRCLVALYTHDAPASIVQDEQRTAVPPFHLAWCLHDGGAVHATSAQGLWMEVPL